MFITVIDDVAERHGDRATLEELLLVPHESRSADPAREGVDGEYVRFLRELWDALLSRYRESPRAEEFEPLFRFDVRQALQSVDYSALLGRYPGLTGERELWTFDVYNMMLFPFADIDLANAPAFETADLAAVRDLVAHGQRMARIGNWIATWQRELAEGDYSAGVVARARESGAVSIDELRAIGAATDATDAADATVDRIVDRIRESGIETEFVERWRRECDAATDLEGEIDSVDVRAYLDGFRPIFRSQLAR